MPKKQTQERFIAASNLIHDHKYGYTKVCYVNNNTPVIIMCPIHGEFIQLPRLHSAEGKGCYKCGKESRFFSTEEFVLSAKNIHGNKFDYSLTVYSHSWNHVKIICSEHSVFEQIASKHLSGQGCPLCAIDNRFLSRDYFLEQANKIHGSIYDYGQVSYKSSREKVIIVCHKHGAFEQTPNSHLSGHGCDKCRSSISRIETVWLDTLNIPEKYRQTTIRIGNKIVKVDALDPETNTVYEFYGDYWHGNPKKFNPNDINVKANKSYGELFNKTMERERLLEREGYNIHSIWRCDFSP